MIRIALIADLHANYPALTEVLRSIGEKKCDRIFHIGDAISIGCYPKECLDLLLDNEKITMITGNHEEYFVHGLDKAHLAGMSEGEIGHQKWTHSKLNDAIKSRIAGFPLRLDERFYNTKISFIHCPFNTEKFEKYTAFKDLRNRTAEELDEIYMDFDADIIAYGHTHIFSDLHGKKRYINPGSVGCHEGSDAFYSIITIFEDRYEVEHCRVPYNKKKLIDEMHIRHVPDRELIIKAFFRE